MRLVFLTPPPTKPSEPALSAPAAAEVMRRLGVNATSVDASIGWHAFVLHKDRLAHALRHAEKSGVSSRQLRAWRSAQQHFDARQFSLRLPSTYKSRKRYTSCVGHAEQALRLATHDYSEIRIGIAMVSPRGVGLRVESSQVLQSMSMQRGPFDAYFVEELIPWLQGIGATHVGVSLTFQQQAPAAFRFARLLAEQYPECVRILGGPLVACWRAVHIPTHHMPFDVFDRVLAGSDVDLARLATELTGQSVSPLDAARAATQGPMSVALDEVPWEAYWCPKPVIPAALGRGCYWRRCTFCPDYLHPMHLACPAASVEHWLTQVARRFPDGSMLHLTDSALPPAHLATIADVIRRLQLPIEWHGFVRPEAPFANPEYVAALAAGGCTMLQFGIESGVPRLLGMMAKGVGPVRIRDVLRATSSVGIRNLAYLIFGLPGETDLDRERTLDFLADLETAIHGVNPALLNLPKGSVMHRNPSAYGITSIEPFGSNTDLSLYDDFRCGLSHPRVEARRWMARRFFKSAHVKKMIGDLRSPFKANHMCFLAP